MTTKYLVSKKILQFSHPFLGNATVCRQITSPITLRDVEWATQTCLLSFNTIGIWPETMDGTDLSTVAKSNNGKLCATGDDCGKIKLYTHPVTQPKVKITYINDSQIPVENRFDLFFHTHMKVLRIKNKLAIY